MRIGAAIHSIRAVEPDEAAVVGEWAAGTGRCTRTSPSSRAENEECLERYGATPAALLPVAENFTAVHATHLTDEDVERLSAGGRSASARRPSATSPTASARPAGSPTRARGWRSAATRTR